LRAACIGAAEKTWSRFSKRDRSLRRQDEDE
jgi:hypothetical protein